MNPWNRTNPKRRQFPFQEKNNNKNNKKVNDPVTKNNPRNGRPPYNKESGRGLGWVGGRVGGGGGGARWRTVMADRNGR